MEEFAQHSIFPPFEERGDSNFAKNWSMHRDCRASEGFISLTSALQDQAGALWNKKVGYFWK